MRCSENLDGPAVILLYHRVNEAVSDPWKLAVSPSRFVEHMNIIRRYRRPMRLTDMLGKLLAGEELCGAVAVSFDDGYADVVDNAVETLERLAVPATFFLTTAVIGAGREWWWDELERVLLQASPLPDRLTLEIDGVGESWDIGLGTVRSEADVLRDRAWQAWSPSAPTLRHALYTTLWGRCQRLSTDQRRGVIDQLLAAVSEDSGTRPSHRIITEAEARRIADSELFDIGAHSVTHTALAVLTRHEQDREICTSRQWLREHLGREVSVFAYPYGKPGDYDRGSVALVREAGFLGACTNVPGPVTAETDRHQLPRIFVQNWEGDEFARHLTAPHV